MGSVFRRLLFLIQRARFDREMDDELRFHAEMKARALAEADGLNDDEARAAARRRVGSPLRLREQSREPWLFPGVEAFVQDARHALRLMRRDPGFTLAALATLALGIGLNTAMFSVAYGVLWRPLPYPDADRLVILSSAQQTDTGPRIFWNWAPAAHMALQQHATTLDALAAYAPTNALLTGQGEPRQVRAVEVSANFFDTLGVTPQRGRAFLAGAAAADDDRSAVISDRLWRTVFDADPAIVGQAVVIDGEARTIVGILPPDFSFRPVIPSGALPDAELFVANRWTADTGERAFLFLLGRLAPGVAEEPAVAELSSLVNDPAVVPTGALAPEGTRAPDVHSVARLVGLQAYGTASVRTLLLVLTGAVSFVLLIACINVANLQMARLTARQGELSVRMALGAGRRRIVCQLLTEAVVLSSLGAALGVGLAHAAIAITLRLVPPALLPRLGGIAIDGRVLAFSLGVSLLSALVIGLMPARRVGAASSGDDLAHRSGGGRVAGDRQGEHVRTVLVAAQIAITLVLLIGAGLLIHSFVRLTAVSPGFEAMGRDGVVQTVRVVLPEHLYDEAARLQAFERMVLERVRYLPGVKAASVVNAAPFGMLFIQTEFDIEGRSRPTMFAGTPKIDTGYFETMGIPLLAGRDFSPEDAAGAPPVAIVSERVAREIAPGQPAAALGRRVRLDDESDWLTVVGVVADIRQRGLDQDVKPLIYSPFQQERTAPFLLRFVSFVARTDTPDRVAEGIRAEIRRVAPDLPIESSGTMDEAVSASVAAPRFRMVLLVLFAAAATLIATGGLYGLMAYTVAQRRREFGLRMALGASRRDVLRLVLSRALRIVVVGLIGGLMGAAAVTRVLQTFLFGVTPTDPLAFAVVTLLLLAVGLLAAWLPARRATRVDPWKALRAE